MIIFELICRFLLDGHYGKDSDIAAMDEHRFSHIYGRCAMCNVEIMIEQDRADPASVWISER